MVNFHKYSFSFPDRWKSGAKLFIQFLIASLWQLMYARSFLSYMVSEERRFKILV